MEFKSKRFIESKNQIENIFSSPDGKKGAILLSLHHEITGNSKKIQKEQEKFLYNLSNLIARYLNRIGSTDQNKNGSKASKVDQIVKSSINNQFLQKFLNKYTDNRDIYHDLMPFKVREILLISSLYDAYAIEKEGRFSEHMLGQYGQLNLTSIPRITAASSIEFALENLQNKHFDLIIYMVGVDKKTRFKSK